MRQAFALYPRTSSLCPYLTVEVAFMYHEDMKTSSRSRIFLTTCVFPLPSLPVSFHKIEWMNEWKAEIIVGYLIVLGQLSCHSLPMTGCSCSSPPDSSSYHSFKKYWQSSPKVFLCFPSCFLYWNTHLLKMNVSERPFYWWFPKWNPRQDPFPVKRNIQT